MLKIISANVNGIRSAYKKGFYEYIAASGADIVCVQELKAQEADLSADMKNPHGMHGHWHCAEKRGYSGVAVYSNARLTMCKSVWALKNSTAKGGLCAAISAGCR